MAFAGDCPVSERNDPNITALINNAGIGSAGPLLTSDVDQMEAMIQLNVVALTRLALAAAPFCRAQERHHRQYRFDCRSRSRGAERLLQRHQGVCRQFHPGAAQGIQGQRREGSGRAAGATATNFWDLAGVPVAHLPAAIVMQADEMVDAALAGLDLGELITIPSLPDAQEWDSYDAARKALGPKLSRTHAASR